MRLAVAQLHSSPIVDSKGAQNFVTEGEVYYNRDKMVNKRCSYRRALLYSNIRTYTFIIINLLLCTRIDSVPCLNGCSGNGVCNSRHHCHCDVGWAGDDCSTYGLGGSVDSGPASQEPDHYALIVSLLILFLGKRTRPFGS